MEPTPQKSDTHLAQERENAEPEERMRPIPLTVVAVVIAMVLFGVVYLLTAEPVGDTNLGDHRTVADLSGPAPAAPGAAVDGKALFAANCAACHQATGKGLPGVFPPLDGSEWAKGEPRVLANILLHGIDGEIEVAGATYKGSMPSFQHLGDADLAGVISYVRGAWSNKAEPIKPEVFEHERKTSTRTKPFEGGAALKALAAGS